MTNVPPHERSDASVLEPDVDATADAEAEPGRPKPDITKLGELMRDRAATRSIGISGLFVLALFYTLYFARDFFLPIVFALLLDFLLGPVVRTLARLRIPTPLGAALVIFTLLGTLGAAAYELSEPAQDWVARAPNTLARMGARLRELRKPVEQVSKTAEQVEEATTVSGPAKTPEVVLKGPSLSQRLFGSTQHFVTGALEVIVLLYFLLAAGDLFLQKLIKVLPAFQDKRKAVLIARETEASVSAYLLTVSMVNVGEGIVVAGVMYLLGMPNAGLWGGLVALLEFIPYLGATAMSAILFLAALTTFNDLGHALLVPGSYLAINVLQANFVSPMVLGHRLTLNPVAVLVGLIFWWWLWDIPGAFIAVPLTATLKIFCDHIETLAPVGEFLGK